MADNRKTIMVVDSDSDDRVLLSGMLSERCHILQASDAEVAASRLKQFVVDAVLLGFSSGNEESFRLLERLRVDPELRQAPVLAVVSGEDQALKTRVLKLDVYDIIEKPLNRDAVLRRVGNLLSRQEAVTAAKQELSSHDPLTGLLTRQAFVSQARELISRKRPGSFELFCIDVDNFKIVNDRCGHTEGDRLLRHISDALKAQLVNSEALVCRDFADEFLVLLPNDGYTFDSILPRFLRQLRSYVLPINVTVHVGRYLIDEPAKDINLMIDWAKMAQRSIKGAAGQTVCTFTEEMRQTMLSQQELVDEMRPALHQGQFVPYFQPQYNYASGEMTGVEALVRWLHPKRGLVSPGEFIPLFERNGFITELDRYLWERVCIHLRDWLDRGLDPVPVSVNISRRDILSMDLPEILEGLVRKYGLSHRMLHLEITESAYTKQPQELVRIVSTLRALGFTVEMDDFGAGYSSLNTLKDVPVDVLKLDMKFVRDSEEHSRGGNILSSVVRMAHWLKLPVIAEGVETQPQADYLKGIGCVLMQGFLFDKPMTAGSFEELLSKKPKASERFTVGGTDIKGLADFLDASTQTTLLFNSFVGGAAIVEYDRKRLECIRANDRFFEEIGFSRQEYVGRSFDLFKSMEPESRERGIAALEEAVSTGRETMCELHYTPRRGKTDLWTHNRIRFLAQNVQNYVFYVAVDNITRRKHLEASRADLDNIVRSIPAGIAIFRLEDRPKPMFISDKTCALFGLELNAENKLLAEQLAADLLPSFDAEDGDLTLDNVVRAQRTDGSSFWLRCVATMAQDQSRQPLIYAILFDVTSQHSKDEELKNIMGLIPGGVFKCDTQQGDKVDFISENLLEMLGCTRQEFSDIYGDKFSSAVYFEDRDRVKAQMPERLEAGASTFSFEYRIVTMSGELKWVFAAGNVVKDVDGHQWIYTVVLDNDGRKRLERELESKSRQSEALLANASGGIIIKVLPGGEMVCEYISEGLSRMLGYEHDELCAMFDVSVNAAVYEEDVERVNAAAARAVDELNTFREDYRLVRKDGSLVWVNLTGNPVAEKNNLIRFYCTYTDITPRILSEKALRVMAEENEIVIRQSGKYVIRYDIVEDRATSLIDAFAFVGLPPVIEDYRRALDCRGIVAESSCLQAHAFFDSMTQGVPEGSCELQMRVGDELRWFHADYSLIHQEGEPDHAIISFYDITEQRELE